MQSLSWGVGSVSRIRNGTLLRSAKNIERCALFSAYSRHHEVATDRLTWRQLPISAPQTPSHQSLRRLLKPERQPTYTQQRFCSHRRNMCRANDHGSATITKVREVLPADVKPIHYNLTLEPDLKTFEYHGEVSIE